MIAIRSSPPPHLDEHEEQLRGAGRPLHAGEDAVVVGPALLPTLQLAVHLQEVAR